MTDSFTNIENEMIFSNSTLSLSENDDELVSDKVNILANGIYEEFEKLIKQHGAGTVDGLTPLVVTILETMDKLYGCRDELALQLDLIKEDQSQLYTQYEREKLSRRLAEEKNNRIEDQFEEERQRYEGRIEEVEGNLRLSEMRTRNCRDLIARHEEKECEMRKEFNSLQQRYSELLRSKAEHKSRNINSQCTTEEVSSGCQSPQLLVKSKSDKPVTKGGQNSVVCLKDNLSDEIDSRAGEFIHDEMTVINELSLQEEFGEDWEHDNLAQNPLGESTTDGEPILYLDVNEENFENVSQNNNDSHMDDEEIGLDNEFDDLGMSREIEFLLKENQDLIETKNALNIVKDDLITKVDELTGQLCLLQDELRTANTLKNQYKFQKHELEKKCSDISHQLKEKEEKILELMDDNLIECPYDQNGIQTKTKFTRAEVSRILMERNKYKEELLELQETMKYQMSVLNQRNEKAKKGGMWNFFNNVLSTAAAFTTETVIGSGNEVTVSQLNRKFITYNRDTSLSKDDIGAMPNAFDGTSAFRKRPIPGSVVRVSNPLFNPLQDNPTEVTLVPLDNIDRTTPTEMTIDNSSV